MNAIDDRSPPLVKQSRVRKLRTHTRSATSSSSSANTSPNVTKEKKYHQCAGIDTDEGYASVTTASTTTTTLASTSTSTWNKDDSAYYTIVSERLPSSSSRLVVESDSDKTDSSDEDDVLRDLVDWPSLNMHVQALVSRLDKWLHDPLPDRHLSIEQPYVEHAYPLLQRRTPALPLSIDLADVVQTNRITNQSDYVVNFVQNNEQPKPSVLTSALPPRSSNISRPRVHFNLPTEELQHCTSCSRLIQLTSSSISTNKQRSFTSCPYCTQVYCSKICQKTDWPVHKRRCALSYSYSCCGYILRLMKSNLFLLERLSTLASSGYLASGRGATLLYFDSMKEADIYVQSNRIENTRLMAVYWPLIDGNSTGSITTNLATQNLRSIEYDHLKELCSLYDPRTEFVCHVTIRVETEIDDPRYTCVSRTIVYKLLDILSDPPPTSSLTPSTYPTLYLTSLNYGSNNNHNHHHMRHVFFANLQVELRTRGIEIEKHYPELYDKLCDYLSPSSSSPSTDENLFSFTPVCLFMRHRYSNQLFMCVITPESEPDRSWLLDRCLIEHQLANCQQNSNAI